LEEKIIELLKTHKQDVSDVTIDLIKRTGNNKAAIVRTKNTTFFVKNYFNSTLDNRDRFNSEVLFFQEPRDKVIYYQYESIYPHAGSGKRIQF